MIWSFVKPEQRVIHLRARINHELQGIARYQVALGQTRPGILASTFDGRVAGLKICQPLFRYNFGEGSPSFYFNLETDYLALNYKAMRDIIMRIASLSHHDQNQLSLAKKLMVEVGCTKVRTLQLVKICQIFSGLSKMCIIEQNIQ